ncbi:MAG: DUF4340 domain-containing protein [Bacteroidetes bacterium]|nr:DUF4340 domain-containing protein [Bacteroidota bacterium]
MSKSTKILVGVLVVLGIIYAVQRITSTTSTTQSSRPFAEIDTAKVVKISIDFGRQIVLEKAGALWKITSPIQFAAAASQVDMLLSRVAANPSATVVADNLSDSSAYGLGSLSPLLKLAEASGKSVSIRVGDVSPDFNGCYIQVAGKKKIMELSANIRTLVGQSLSNWREKKIFGFGTSDIEAIDFSLGDTLYHFFHRDTLWRVNGTDVPEMTAQNVVESLIGTTALGFVDSTVDESGTLVDYGITLSNREHITGKIFKLTEPKGSFPQICLLNSANHQVYTVSSTLPADIEQALRMIYSDYLTNKRS